jgi:hypothetical protein
MIPGPAFHFEGPREPDLDTQEKDAREEIGMREKFAKAIWRVLPCFVTESAISRMGLENVATLLEEFHGALRDHFCKDVEYHLGKLIERRKNPERGFPPKPTDEQLVSAQMNVSRFEDAIAAMDNLGEKEQYAFGAYVAMMRPILEGNLDQARQHLTWIQTAIERFDEAIDEATESSVSNGQAAGEEKHPDEAES